MEEDAAVGAAAAAAERKACQMNRHTRLLSETCRTGSSRATSISCSKN